ncbi:hypothetical protein AOLI_G00231450 [Acnodon oligacanthus]
MASSGSPTPLKGSKRDLAERRLRSGSVKILEAALCQEYRMCASEPFKGRIKASLQQKDQRCPIRLIRNAEENWSPRTFTTHSWGRFSRHRLSLVQE